MDRITGLQDLQDRMMVLTVGCLDRMAGLQDLQDRLFWLNWGLFGQDYRISGFTG
jgi:hypothetical protein